MEVFIVGEVSEGVADDCDRLIDGFGRIAALLDGVPKLQESSAFGDFDAGVVDGEGSGENVEFPELCSAIDDNVLGVAFPEKHGCFLDSAFLLEQSCLAADLFDLFWLEVFLEF